MYLLDFQEPKPAVVHQVRRRPAGTGSPLEVARFN